MSGFRFGETKRISELDPESKVVVYYWAQGCATGAALGEVDCPPLRCGNDLLFVSSRLSDCHKDWNELEVHSDLFGQWSVVCKVRDLFAAVSILLEQVRLEYNHELRNMLAYAAAAIVQDKLQIAEW